MNERGDMLLGRIVLVEHRLDALVREDAALSVYSATSTVDGGTYTVAIAREAHVATASTGLETAVEKSGRHAVGVRGLHPVLHARAIELDDGSRLGVVRRGAPFPSVAELFDGTRRSISEVVRLLGPVADALLALHDQGLAHGALSSTTLVRRGAELSVDFFGLSQAAEAADGARGASAAVPPNYRAEELASSIPGPYSDVFSLAVLAVELLSGQGEARERAGAGTLPTPRALGLEVGDRLEAAFAKALSSSPSQRPSVTGFLSALASAASETDAAIPTPPPAPVVPPEVPFPAPEPMIAPPAPFVNPPAYRAPVAIAPRYVSQDSSGKWLVLGVVVGLVLFAVVLSGMTAFVLTRAPSTTPAASATAPPMLPPPPPTAPLDAPPPSIATTPPRTGGTPAYPADHDALLPVDADAIVRGDRDALLTLVLFGDLTEPFTARELAMLPQLEARYGGDLRVVFKHFPLPAHPEAARASEALSVARARGGNDEAWRFLELVVHSGERDPGSLEELGIKAGLPAGAITQGLANHASQKQVERDVELGRRLGVRGAPVLFFNGRRVDGLRSRQALEMYLDAEVARARKTLAKGTSRETLYAARVLVNVTTTEGEKPPNAPSP